MGGRLKESPCDGSPFTDRSFGGRDRACRVIAHRRSSCRASSTSSTAITGYTSWRRRSGRPSNRRRGGPSSQPTPARREGASCPHRVEHRGRVRPGQLGRWAGASDLGAKGALRLDLEVSSDVRNWLAPTARRVARCGVTPAAVSSRGGSRTRLREGQLDEPARRAWAGRALSPSATCGGAPAFSVSLGAVPGLPPPGGVRRSS